MSCAFYIYSSITSNCWNITELQNSDNTQNDQSEEEKFSVVFPDNENNPQKLALYM